MKSVAAALVAFRRVLRRWRRRRRDVDDGVFAVEEVADQNAIEEDDVHQNDRRQACKQMKRFWRKKNQTVGEQLIQSDYYYGVSLKDYN